MKTVQDTLTLTAAPTEALLVVGIVFAVSALILFALALEAGTYPRLAGAIKRLPERIHRWRQGLHERIHRSSAWHRVSGNGAH
jgi:hypothetical protein